MLIQDEKIFCYLTKEPSHELLNTARVEFHSFRLLYLWRYLIGSAIKIISDESMMMMWWVRMYLTAISTAHYHSLLHFVSFMLSNHSILLQSPRPHHNHSSTTPLPHVNMVIFKSYLCHFFWSHLTKNLAASILNLIFSSSFFYLVTFI